jgi:hypothetical protein
MIRITLNIDDALFRAKLEIPKKQWPFATALALTKTAQAVKTDLSKEMGKAFENPTTYTLNSLKVERAEKATLVATVGVRGGDQGKGAVRWLAPEIAGGGRSHAIEAMLEPLGLPPAGMYAVPGNAAKTTGSGKLDINWFRSLVSDITSQGISEARGIVTKRTKGTGKKRQGALQYVVLMTKWGKLLPGIYGRRGRGIFPFILFVRPPKYRAKYDFYGVATRTANARFPDEFKAAIAKALATAR